MIIWCSVPETVGSTVHRSLIGRGHGELVAVDHPFTVLRRATREEYEAQARESGIDTDVDEWNDPASETAYYYEVSTD